MNTRVQELEYVINTLMNAIDYYKKDITEKEHELELIRKHNQFLQDRYSGPLNSKVFMVSILTSIHCV